jgi:hypothetical protein
MRPFLFFILVVLAFTTVHPAAAVQITFADLNIINGMKVIIDNSTGGFVGEYNTTDTTPDLTEEHYVFIFKPSAQSLFTSPQGTVDFLSGFLPISINYFIAGVLLFGIAYGISKMWK